MNMYVSSNVFNLFNILKQLTFLMIQYNAWFKIHASFKKILMVRVKHHLPTEEWLYMDIFNLSSATGQYQTITQCYKLSIHNNTVIIQGDLPFNNEFFYTFIKFADISNEISKPNFLVGTFIKSFYMYNPGRK